MQIPGKQVADVLLLDGTRAMTGNLQMGGNIVHGSSASGGNLKLRGTSDPSVGAVNINDLGGDVRFGASASVGAEDYLFTKPAAGAVRLDVRVFGNNDGLATFTLRGFNSGFERAITMTAGAAGGESKISYSGGSPKFSIGSMAGGNSRFVLFSGGNDAIFIRPDKKVFFRGDTLSASGDEDVAIFNADGGPVKFLLNQQGSTNDPKAELEFRTRDAQSGRMRMALHHANHSVSHLADRGRIQMIGGKSFNFEGPKWFWFNGATELASFDLANNRWIFGGSSFVGSETVVFNKSQNSNTQILANNSADAGALAETSYAIRNNTGTISEFIIRSGAHATKPNWTELRGGGSSVLAIDTAADNSSVLIRADSLTIFEAKSDATFPKLGFFAKATVPRQAQTVDFKDAFIAYGLITGGPVLATPLNLDGGNLTGGVIQGTAAGGGSAAGLRSVSAGPGIELRDTDAALNEKSWDVLAGGTQLFFRAVNDANTASDIYMQVDRTAAVIDRVTFPSPLTFSAFGAGRLEASAAGVVSSKAPITFRAKQSVGSVALGTSFGTITGASVTLTVAGTYRIALYGRSRVNAPSKFVTYRLFNVTAAAALADSEVIAGFDNVTAVMTDSQNSCAMETFVTITASTTIRLEAQGSTATGCESLDNVNGHTVLVAERI